MNTVDRQHKKDVTTIAAQMKNFFKQKKKVRIYHGSTTSTRTQKFKKDEFVDVSMLTRVLEVNTEKGYAIVEPNVAMDGLFQKIIAFGFVPPVVMEFAGITVGGGIQGIAGENSSFKWGFFHETCLEYELVLGNGEIITASPKKNADLFWGLAGSYGSLAIITKIKIKIIPAKPFVKLTYLRVTDFTQAVELIADNLKQSIDFVDGILFSKTQGTVMIGTFSEKEHLPVAYFQKAFDDWFYTHAETITKKHKVWTELIPLEDYLFRHNRGTYWVGKYAFDKLHIPFNRLTRFIFNPVLKARTLMRFLQSINVSQRHFLQDFVFPKKTSVQFLEYSHKKLHIYPVYLCPGMVKHTYDKLSPTNVVKSGMVMDIGIWGHVNLDYQKFVAVNREVEHEVKKLSGRKWLYAHQYYTNDEFWKIYDKHWYQSLREKYHTEEVFPDVYQKTMVKEKYTYSLIKGLIQVLKSPFKLPVLNS